MQMIFVFLFYRPKLKRKKIALTITLGVMFFMANNYFFFLAQPYLKATLLCHTTIDPKNNKKYIYVDTFKWDITIKGGKTHFYNLFNGNKVLGDTVNSFFQNNALDLFNLIKHMPEKEFGLFFKDVVNDFFRRFTYDELFLRD